MTLRSLRRLHGPWPWWPRLFYHSILLEEPGYCTRQLVVIFWRRWRAEILYGPTHRR